MERKEGPKIRLNELPENPLYELRRCGARNALFDKELKAYKTLFDEDEVMDDSYKIIMACLFEKEERFEPQTKRKGKEKVNELLLYIPMKGGRFQSRMNLKDKDHLIEHDGVCKNAGKTGLRGKRKAEDHLLERDDVRENVGKALKRRFELLEKLKDEEHSIEYDGVRANAEKALKERFGPSKKRKGKDHMIEDDDVRENAGKALKERLEPPVKRKGKDHLIERDDVRANAGKALRERFEPREKRKGIDHLIGHDDVRENAGKALNERLASHEERKRKDHLIEQDGVRENAEEENDSEYKLFLKHLKELGKSYAVEYKKDSINVVIKYKKSIGLDKDCELEPRRKWNRIMKQNRGLPNQVPNVEKLRQNDQKANSLKSSRRGRKSSNEVEKVEIEKFSPGDLRNVIIRKPKYEDEEVDIKNCSARDFRDVVMKRSRNDAEKAGIEKCSAREFRNVIMKKSRNEDEKVEIEKCSACQSRNLAMKTWRDEDDNVEIEKCWAPEFRNVVMKKISDENEKIEIDKWSARVRNVVMRKPRDADEDEDEKAEIEKLPARDFRNIVLEKSRDEAEMAEIEKLPARGFRNHVRGVSKSSMPCRNINKNDAEESEDSDVEILDMNGACLNGPFVPSKRFSKTMGENGSRSSDSSDEFRRQVMEVLMKPFDKDEYIVLKTEFEARCYTDYHPDLGRKLKKWRYNRRKRLAILRGFFFWLQNLTREGAFKPWKHGVCLAVEPQSPETNPGNTSGS